MLFGELKVGDRFVLEDPMFQLLRTWVKIEPVDVGLTYPINAIEYRHGPAERNTGVFGYYTHVELVNLTE